MLEEVIFKGFKSFADEQTIRLSEGINGIIGPNGCGKSNLIDGISFVLGAQSAKGLRGGKMTDLIFSGSARTKRKDNAEVTLVLSNKDGIFKKTDKEKISVTRKLHKSGGSEYYINGEPCRLKDLQELFMDTGVGSDSYSIIGQNQVNKILSTKLEERRSIFEEASGIVKLRQQKEKTEKNLKDADVDIIRIEDIVVEIERQLKPLERQSKKAEEFVVLDEELKSLELQYLLHEYKELKEVINTSNERSEKIQQFISEKEKFIIETEEKNDLLKEDYSSKNKKSFEIQEHLGILKESIEKYKGNISLIEEKISNAEKTISEYDNRLKEVENEHIFSVEEFKNKQKRINSISKELIELDSVYTEIENELIKLEVEKSSNIIDIDTNKQKLVDLMNKVNKKTLELENIIQNREEIKEKEEKIKERNSNYKTDKEKIEEEYLKAKTKYEETKEKIEKVEKEVYETTNKLNDLNQKKTTLSNEISNENARLYQATSKLNTLQSFIENNEGFYEGVKAILNEKKKGYFQGVIGAVAELITIENKYEQAYENLLQSSMQHMITENDQVAKEAVSYLKNNNKGRVTFLPLNMAKPYIFDSKEKEKIEKTKGIYQALDFVKYGEKIEPVIQNILGRSLIAEDMDVAVEFMKKSNVKCRISTLDGELVQINSITGGANNKGKKSSVLSKKNEIESLRKEVSILEEALNRKTNVFENVKEGIQKLIEEAKTKNQEVTELKFSTNSIQATYEEKKMEMEIFNEKTKDIQLEEREIAIKISNYSKQESILKMEIEQLERDQEQLSYKMTNTEGESGEISKNYEEKREQKTELLLKINTLKEESRQLNGFMDEIGQDSGTLEEKIEKLYKAKQDELQSIERNKKEKEIEQKELLKLEREIIGVNADIEKYLEECEKINVEIKSNESEIKRERDEKEKEEKENNKIKILLSKKETEFKTNLSRLKDVYDITEENIDAFELREIDYEKSKKRIIELRKLITNLGNVNIDSIEEYQKIKERYSNEKGQLDDIKSAKKDLKTLLENVENEMIERFTTTFEEIAKTFTITYKELFEGGNAKLFLKEPEKPLESEIEIIAQPPGKKPTSLSLLSGGEKAFTAVALIFAIITAKPSPFVILDEIDAPLDEINVFRFAKQLSRYKEKSQFVVITHRKGTMMATDSLTGITQKEKGVSIVFPYTVKEKEEMIAKIAK